MKYKRMPIEVESPEEMGYEKISYNLAESSVRDIYFKDLNINLDELFLCYGEHRGDSKLREIIVKEEKNLNQSHVLVCPSAATALFIVSTTLLNEKDHLIVLRPNYATNIETPRAINSEISYVELAFEKEFQFEVEEVIKLLKPNTKLISITNPHNPTAVIFEDKKIKQLIALAEEREIYLLVDETYRYLHFQSEIIPYYANESDRVISVCSLSKAFGVPGIRIGWLITQNQSLMHDFLAAKEQIIICNSVVDETIALHILENKDNMLPSIHKHIKTNFEVLQKWMKGQDYMEWIEPKVGVVCFPRIKLDINIDLPKFYKILFEKYTAIVGPGHWFEQTDRYMRIGFGYPLKEEFENGLENLKRSIEESRR
jgi:aspartate/methionine/tyrosine aminotransferase